MPRAFAAAVAATVPYGDVTPSDLRIGRTLKMFVYDLSPDYNQRLSAHVEAVALKQLRVRDWLSQPSDAAGFSHFENMRSHCADPIIYHKFMRAVPRTLDPAAADLFLVPVFAGTDALLGWGHGLQRINPEAHRAFWSERWAPRHLAHWSTHTSRHVILDNMNSDQVPRWWGGATAVHLGPTRLGPHHIIVPYLIHQLALQPSVWGAKHTAGAAKRPTRVFLQMNPSRNPIRKIIGDQLRGAPGARLIEHLQHSPAEALAEMRRSVFCVAPAGDSSSFCVRFYFGRPPRDHDSHTISARLTSDGGHFSQRCSRAASPSASTPTARWTAGTFH